MLEILFKFMKEWDSVEDTHDYSKGCTCSYSFNGVLDSIDPDCPLLAEERAAAKRELAE